jgi:hypothetical protein
MKKSGFGDGRNCNVFGNYLILAYEPEKSMRDIVHTIDKILLIICIKTGRKWTSLSKDASISLLKVTSFVLAVISPHMDHAKHWAIY